MEFRKKAAAYRAGFMSKCAEHGVDVNALLKAAGVKTQLIRALMNGPNGVKSYTIGRKRLGTLQKLVARVNAGGTSASMNRRLTRRIHDLADSANVSLHGAYDVLDPTGFQSMRFRNGVSNQLHNADMHRHGFPEAIASGRTSMVGSQSRSLRQPHSVSLDLSDFADDVGGYDYGIDYSPPYWDSDALRDIYETAMAQADNLGAKETARRNLMGHWTARRAMGSVYGIGLEKGLRPELANVPLLPGEAPADAIRRAMLQRVAPGTRAASGKGLAAIRNTPIYVDSSAVPPSRITMLFDSILSRRVPGYMLQGLNSIGPRIARNFNSFQSPTYAQLAGAQNGDVVTFMPNVAMHEIAGHGLQEFGAERLNGMKRLRRRLMFSPGSVSGRPSRSSRAFRSRYGDGGGVLPVAGSVRDPIQVFRQMSPEIYGEVAADANAFGTRSAAWPADIRRALSTYVLGDLSSPEILKRMPGSTMREKLRNLDMYHDMLMRFAGNGT